jgi:sugar lactone lactonase YvrE
MLGGVDRKTLFMVATEWRGTEHMADGTRTGEILSTEAPARGVGWP